MSLRSKHTHTHIYIYYIYYLRRTYMFNPTLVIKKFQTWLLIGCNIANGKSQVRKSLLTDKDFKMDFLSNVGPRMIEVLLCRARENSCHHDLISKEFQLWLISKRSWSNINPWWRHQMETFSALLALCARNSPVTGEFPSQRPVTRSFDVFFDLR